MKKKLCAIMLFFLGEYYGIAEAEWYFWLDDEKYPHFSNIAVPDKYRDHFKIYAGGDIYNGKPDQPENEKRHALPVVNPTFSETDSGKMRESTWQRNQSTGQDGGTSTGLKNWMIVTVLPGSKGGMIVGGPMNGTVLPGRDGGMIVGGELNGTVLPGSKGGMIVGGPMNGTVLPGQ